MNLSPTHVVLPAPLFYAILSRYSPHLTADLSPALSTLEGNCILPAHLFERMVTPPAPPLASSPAPTQTVDGGAPAVQPFVDMTTQLSPLLFSEANYSAVPESELLELADGEPAQ